jgi:16S rRNA (guanine966-N2)-methyltransferase
LDLFAGTGALAFEALSRGSDHALLVENGRVGQNLIAENIAKLRATDETRVFKQDATNLPAWSETPFDLVFLDPPYGRNIGQKALRSAAVGGWLAQGATIVWEEAAPMMPPIGFEMEDQRKYGDTHVTLLEYTGG